MKKILFGTSALIAAAFGSAGGASAAGIELGFSGGYTFGAGALYSKGYDNGGPNASKYKGVFISDGNILVNAKGTLDNGLSFGARILLPIEGGASYEESVGWVEGSFGRLEIGHEDGAHDRSTPAVAGTWFNAAAGGGILFDYVGVPGATFVTEWGSNAFGSNTPFGSGFTLDGADTSDALKATYWTPSFSGFKAGVSYIPRTYPYSSGRTGNTELTTSNDAWEFGVRYTGNFNDVSVDVGGGYTLDPYGDSRASGIRTTRDSWAVAGNVGFGQFTVGATYEDRGASRHYYGNGDVRGNADHGTGFGVGGTYETGPWTFGAAYARGSSITRADGGSIHDPVVTDLDRFTTIPNHRVQGVSLGVDYQLGQGVVVSGGLEWVDRKRASDLYGVGLVTQLSF